MTQAAGTLRDLAASEISLDRRVGMGLGMPALVLGASFGAYVAIPLPDTAVPLMLSEQGLGSVLAVGVISFLLDDLIKVFLALLLMERLQFNDLGRS